MRRVGILGATGRLGRIAMACIDDADDLEAVAIDPRGTLDALDDVDVVFEATTHEVSERLVREVTRAATPIIVGTSGWSAERIAALHAEQLTGVRIVPNFSVGSVIGTRLAEIAAPFFDAVEIVETHPASKIDAPSGTATRTAERLAAANRTTAPTPDQPGRGHLVEGVAVHALRLPGVAARQEVVFGGNGETLSIRHDTLSGESYSAGILLALRAPAVDGVVVGIDDLLGLP